MSDSIDPSLLTYPRLTPPPSDTPPDSTSPSLISFDSPQLPSGNATNSHSTPEAVFFPPGDNFTTAGDTLTTGGNLVNTGHIMLNTGQSDSTNNSVKFVSQVNPPVTDPLTQHSALHSIHNPQTQGVSGSSDTLGLRVQYLEQMCSKAQHEKAELMEEFGKQRKKFMDKLVEMEAERTMLCNTIERYGREVREISTQLLAKDEELKNVAMATKMSESQTREKFDADRVKYEEEIASLTQILNVQTQEQNAAIRQERELWKREREGMLAEIQRLRQPNSQRYAPSPTNAPMRPPPDSTYTHLTSSSSRSPEGENLDFDMAKAALDTQVLKSVVVPLEEEIDLLKGKLKETQEQLADYQSKTSTPPNQTTSPLIDFDSTATSSTPTGGSGPDSEAMTQLQHQLTLERAARHDLEMHTEAMVQQKTIIHQEILVLTQEMEKYKDRFKAEKREHDALKTEYQALKRTWEQANQQFVENQNSLKQEITSLKRQTPTGDRMDDMFSPPGAGGEREEFVVLKSLEVPTSQAHRRSQSSGKASPAPQLLQRRLSSSLPQLEQLLGSDTPTDTGTASVVEKRMAALQKEADTLREALARKSKMCAQMEAEMMEKERDIDRLRAGTEKLKAGIMRERETQKNLRRSVQENVEQIRSKMDGFRETEKKLQLDVRKRKDFFLELKTDTQTELARVTKNRDELRRQMETAQEEYDCLKVVQSQQIGDYQQTYTTERAARLDAEQKLQMTRQQLAALQSRLQATEEDLVKQLSLVQEQLHSETQQKEKLTSELMVQLRNLQKENAGLQSLKTDIEVERRAKEEALNSKTSIQDKSTAFIQDQQKQIEKLHQDKEAKEKQVGELMRQVSSLKHQLDRTSETQKDFVELSQSLQMKLAEIEESKMGNTSDSPSDPGTLG